MTITNGEYLEFKSPEAEAAFWSKIEHAVPVGVYDDIRQAAADMRTGRADLAVFDRVWRTYQLRPHLRPCQTRTKSFTFQRYPQLERVAIA